MTIRLAFSPDSDDVFMFWALLSGRVDPEGLTFTAERDDTELTSPDASDEIDPLLERAAKLGFDLVSYQTESDQTVWEWRQGDGPRPQFVTERVARQWMAEWLSHQPELVEPQPLQERSGLGHAIAVRAARGGRLPLLSPPIAGLSALIPLLPLLAASRRGAGGCRRVRGRIGFSTRRK